MRILCIRIRDVESVQSSSVFGFCSTSLTADDKCIVAPSTWEFIYFEKKGGLTDNLNTISLFHFYISKSIS